MFTIRAEEQLIKDFELACTNRSIVLGRKVTKSEVIRQFIKRFNRKNKN